MKCTECRYSLIEDEGYSNWTVTGETVFCLLNLNPAFPRDDFYGTDPALLYAEQCTRFQKGDGVRIDVDREERISGMRLSATYTDDDEIKPLLDAWENAIG